MDLLDLSQLPCFKCNTITNPLADQQQQSQAICDRCLQAQTRKYIRLGMEIQSYEKKIKQIKEDFAQKEKVYRQSINHLESAHNEISPNERNEMGKELLTVQQELAKEQEESARLLEELRKVEEQEMTAAVEYHRKWIALEQTQQEIAEQQSYIKDLKQFKGHILTYGKVIDETIGK